MVRILALGDPHGSEKIKKIPIKDIDLILVPGDIGDASLMQKLYNDRLNGKKVDNKLRIKGFIENHDSAIKLLKYLSKFAPVFLVYGDLEYGDEITKKRSKELNYKLPYFSKSVSYLKNVRIINNKLVSFKGIRILGLEIFKDVNWVEEFKPDSYEKRLKIAEKQTLKARNFLNKKNTDILLCHYPPYGVLDKISSKRVPKKWLGKHSGSRTILEYIEENHPKLVLCGHIHNSKGKKKIGDTIVYNLGHSGDYQIIEIN